MSDSPRRILLIHRYFWPDSPPYASLLRAIGDHLAGLGHTVSVLSTQPSYKVEIENERRPRTESLGDLRVVRCRLLPERSRSPLLRGLNSLLFGWQIFWHVLIFSGRYDAVMCSTVPPVITGMATGLACRLRGSKFIYHSMDIWPEVAHLSGQLKQGFLYRVLRRLDTWSCRLASSIVCLSGDMRQTYLQRDPNLEQSLQVIGNFELPDYNASSEQGLTEDLRKPAGKFRVLFAGNVGRYQGLGHVIDAAKLTTNPNIEFVLLGEGAAKAALIQQARTSGCLDRNVRFFSHQPATIAKQMMKDADLCLVTLAEGVSKVAYPSKTLTLLAMGCPLAVMVETDSELAKSVDSNQLGFAVNCGDSAALAAQTESLAIDSTRLEQIRQNVRTYADSHAIADAVLPAWGDLITDVFASKKPDHAHQSALPQENHA